MLIRDKCGVRLPREGIRDTFHISPGRCFSPGLQDHLESFNMFILGPFHRDSNSVTLGHEYVGFLKFQEILMCSRS